MADYWLIDTNLLVDWALFEMDEQYPALALGEVVRGLQYLSLAMYRDYLAEKLDERRVATSASVATEVGWVGRRLLRKGGSGPFLESFHRIATHAKLEIRDPAFEDVHRLSQAGRFNEQGHTDASLVVLSERLFAQGHRATILTGERALEHWCAMNNVPAERFTFEGR
ncbi:MAG: hypothetical protein JNJ54_31540 [Myxococcaceae bacterium]|nr:hypothetical protein [Myxococcaceae bacterium]